MEADPNDPSVMLAAATDLWGDGEGDIDSALALARRAYALNPNAAIIANSTGWFEWVRGNYDASLACRLHALALSPGAPERFWSLSGIAQTHLSAGRVEEALVWALRAIEANPDFEATRVIVIACYALLGEAEEAQRALAALLAAKPETTIGGLRSQFAGRHNQNLRNGLTKLEPATRSSVNPPPA